MILGIDIDNTITNTAPLVMDYIRKYSPELEMSDIHNLDNPKMLKFFHTYLEDIFKNVTLKDNAKEVINHLHELGYKIIIITARGDRLNRDYFEVSYNYLSNQGINFDKLVAKSGKKGIDAKRENVDIFIDDEEFNLDDVHKEGIKCFKFNSNHKTSKYETFDNWLEIDKYLTNLVRGN
jgi:uncharacterized HAD superfamily protein